MATLSGNCFPLLRIKCLQRPWSFTLTKRSLNNFSLEVAQVSYICVNTGRSV